MPRKPHEPTPELRQTVQIHATVGTNQETIARILNIDAKTLRKHYRDELDISLAKANATIGGALFNKAKNGDTAAQIFWMKTQAKWRETSDVNLNANVDMNVGVSPSDELQRYIDGIAERRGKTS